jgi:hypothetical protein
MAKLSKKNPKFRTKDQMVNDVHGLLNSDFASEGLIREAIHTICWTWTQHEGKYAGCPNFSPEAAKIPEAEWCGKNVIHEHIVPKTIIINYLMNTRKLSKAKIREYFDTHLIGVIVTKEEDLRLNSLGLRQKMPAGFTDENHELFADPFARHKTANIQLV